MLLFFVHEPCTTGSVVQDIGGTPRDVRCRALVGSHAVLHAILAVVSPTVTLAAGTLRPLRRVTMTACVASTIVMLGYVVHLANAADVTTAP